MLINIMIADDHAILRQGIRNVLELEPNFQVIAEAGDGEEAVEKAVTLVPDILLLDISMGDMNGFEITRRLRSDLCRSKIIFLTVHEELEFIRAAFDAGASGYVFKSRMNKDLRTAINTVMNEKVFLPEAPIPD